MRIVNFTQDKEARDFAAKACICFKENPSYYVYTHGDPEAGKLMAVRWNSFTVLVVKLDDNFVPELHSASHYIKEDFANLLPS